MRILPNGIAVLDPPDLASRWIEECGDLVHEPTVRAEICPLLKKGDVVVDAGAFLGAHTRAYLDAVGPTGKVLAFEPNPLAFECLKHNCPGAELYRCGLGQRDMLVSGRDDASNHGAHWLDSEDARGDIKVMRLDSLQFMDRLDFIKIDVEGWEPFVIKGAEPLLEKFHPVLYVELNHGSLALQGWTVRDLVYMIQALGYRIQFLDPKHNLKMDQIDVFFFPL